MLSMVSPADARSHLVFVFVKTTQDKWTTVTQIYDFTDVRSINIHKITSCTVPRKDRLV